MNERILELAKQAGLKFPSETAMSPVELKFAELIVRDCIDVVDGYDTKHYLQSLKHIDHICKHFGVEE